MPVSSGGTLTWGAMEITVAVGETKTVTYESTFGSPNVTLSAWSEALNYASIAVATTDTYHGTVSFTGIAAGETTISVGATVGFETTSTNQLKITVVEPTQVIVAEQSLQDIADAIRGKLGVATTYKPADMASAIATISSGGMDLSSIFNGCQQFEVGTFRPSSTTTRYTLNHSLGVAPCLILVLDPQSLNSWVSDYSYTKVVFGMCYQDPNMTISGGAPSGTGFSLAKYVVHYRNSTSTMTGDYYMQASKGTTDSTFGNGLFSATERTNMCYGSSSSSVVLNFGNYYMMSSVEYNYILGAPNT